METPHGHRHDHGRAQGDAAAHGPAHGLRAGHGAHAGHSHAGHMHAGHSHAGHAHPGADTNFDRAFAIGIALNVGFVAVEAFYGWKVDSLALLADAGHNLSDVAGLVLAWVAALAGRARPDARHTYGFQRAGILAAFANAVLLLVAMGSLAWEALHRLASPAPTHGLVIVAVAGAGIVVNGATALLFARGRHADLNIRGAYLHMAADALVSAGVMLSGGLALAFGWRWLDPAASLAVALVIVVGSWGLLRQSLHLLFDGVPEGVDLGAVQRTLEALPGVARVHDLHVWATGTSQTALTAHLVMPGEPRGDDAFLQRTTALLRSRFGIQHVTLQTMLAPFAPGCAGQPATGEPLSTASSAAPVGCETPRPQVAAAKRDAPRDLAAAGEPDVSPEATGASERDAPRNATSSGEHDAPRDAAAAGEPPALRNTTVVGDQDTLRPAPAAGRDAPHGGGA